jgi:hypothetical protein
MESITNCNACSKVARIKRFRAIERQKNSRVIQTVWKCFGFIGNIFHPRIHISPLYGSVLNQSALELDLYEIASFKLDPVIKITYII